LSVPLSAGWSVLVVEDGFHSVPDPSLGRKPGFLFLPAPRSRLGSWGEYLPSAVGRFSSLFDLLSLRLAGSGMRCPDPDSSRPPASVGCSLSVGRLSVVRPHACCRFDSVHAGDRGDRGSMIVALPIPIPHPPIPHSPIPCICIHCPCRGR